VHGPYGWGMYGAGWMIFSMIFWLLILGGFVSMVVWLIRRSGTPTGGAETPLDIVKKRYARGEITRDEFEQMKRDLS
jgi:putative membrane protein